MTAPQVERLAALLQEGASVTGRMRQTADGLEILPAFPILAEYLLAHGLTFAPEPSARDLLIRVREYVNGDDWDFPESRATAQQLRADIDAYLALPPSEEPLPHHRPEHHSTHEPKDR